MVTDNKGTIVYMNKDEAETFGAEEYATMLAEQTPILDSDLGLELIPEQPSIFEKYGVHCDPTKNSFYKSLYDQYQKSGRLSERQIDALKKPRY